MAIHSSREETTIEPARGDSAARSFSEAVVSLRPLLYRRAFMLTGQRDRADDLVQEAMVKALAAHLDFCPSTNVGAWLSSIMRNAFFDECRKNKSWQRLVPFVAGSIAQQPQGELWLDLVSFADVEACVTALPPSDRELFRLAYVERVNNRGIAERLRILETTAGTRLFRLRAKLRALLEELVDRRLQIQTEAKDRIPDHGLPNLSPR